MDIPTLSKFLSPILTVASVWNTTGETGDIYPAMNHGNRLRSMTDYHACLALGSSLYFLPKSMALILMIENPCYKIL